MKGQGTAWVGERLDHAPRSSKQSSFLEVGHSMGGTSRKD